MPTIDQLTPAGPITASSDVLPISQGGVSYKVTLQSILSALLSQLPVIMPYSYVFGMPLGGSALFNYNFGMSVILPTGLTGSNAACGGAPTNAISLPIIMGGTLTASGTITGGTQVGTVNYAAGSTVGTFTFTAAVTGTTFGVEMPVGGDLTFANPSITLVGSRSS